MNEWDYENGFYHTAPVRRIGKLLAHYELYKKIVDLPGEIVEVGVYKAASFVRFCSFRQLLENDFSRKIIGFDAFGKFPVPVDVDESDIAFVEEFERDGDGLSVDKVEKILVSKSIQNYELIPGDIGKTLEAYIAAHQELKIALLHVDVDIYTPTKLVMELLYPRVVKGGVVVLDDYAKVAGATRAVDEYFDNAVVLNKLSLAHIPAFIVK